jgi:hypothetical protein
MAALDCDTFPENNNFIANYVNQINSSAAKAFWRTNLFEYETE